MHCEERCVPTISSSGMRPGMLPVWRLVCVNCGKATSWHIQPGVHPPEYVTKMMEDYAQKTNQPVTMTEATLDELRGYFADL